MTADERKYTILHSRMHNQVKGWDFESNHSSWPDKMLIEQSNNIIFRDNVIIVYNSEFYKHYC